MESGKRVQPWRTMVLCGILGALLIAQEATSLKCHRCTDANDGGCTSDRIKIEECAAPRNVCLEAIHVVTLDNKTLYAAIKGCDVGTLPNSEFTSDPSDSFSQRSRIHACSQDLCNTLVTADFIKRPDNNGSRPSVPRDNECYSCLSTSVNQCSAENAAVVKCHGNEEVCFDGFNTITLGNWRRIIVPYFTKKCSDTFCTRVTTSGEFLQHKQTGSCCRGNICNGVLPATPSLPPSTSQPPNTGLRPTTCVAHLILAAILVIARM